MLTVKFDEAESIAILEPDGELVAADFMRVADTIDPYIENSGGLTGIIIHVKYFPGWDSFAAFITHLKFIKEHHKNVSYVAFVTDSPVGSFAEHIASHFVNAKIKSFTFSEYEKAVKWIADDSDG